MKKPQIDVSRHASTVHSVRENDPLNISFVQTEKVSIFLKPVKQKYT